MILYDKESNLLGMSKSVLDLLGYEDLEEFKTFTNDVADLFEQRSGYVYRFKNFSWISYVLHSGAPNKNAILRLKNNKELEVRILIEEVLLLEPSQNGGFYKVDLEPIQGHFSKPFSHDSSIHEAQPEPKEFLPKEPAFEDSDFITSEFSDQTEFPNETLDKTNQDQNQDSGISFMDPSEFSISSNESKDYGQPLPVSFDEPNDNHISLDSNQNSFTKISFDDEEPKESLEASLNIGEPIDEVSQDYEEEAIKTQEIEEIQPQESEETEETENQLSRTPQEFNLDDYDPKRTLDALGLEPNELKLFLHEYCDHIEMVGIALEDAINDHDIEGKRALLMQLKGTSAHLRLHHISSLLEKLSHSDDLESLRALQEHARALKNFPINN